MVPPGDYTMYLSGLNSDGVSHQVRRDVSVPEGKVTRLMAWFDRRPTYRSRRPFMRRQRNSVA